jgi:hypothetical protein
MRTIGVAIGLLVLVQAFPAAAEDGHFRGLAVLFNTKFNEIKLPADHPGKTMMQGEMDGLVFNAEQAPFLDKAHYEVVWTADGTGASYCYKTFSMPDGKVFARCEGQPTPTGAKGTVKLLGGTGRYTGINGVGRFTLTNVSERVMWDLLEWDHIIPR